MFALTLIILWDKIKAIKLFESDVKLMIIDAHNHAEWEMYDSRTLIRDMDSLGIEKTWLLSWNLPQITDFGEYEKLNDGGFIFNKQCASVSVPFLHCVDYKNSAPDRYVLGYAPNPLQPNPIDCFKEAVEKYDIRICGEVIFRAPYNCDELIEIFRICGDRNMPVVLHIDFENGKTLLDGTVLPPVWTYGGNREVIEDMLTRCPKTNFIGHASFWKYISGEYKNPSHNGNPELFKENGILPELLAAHGNLYCDMSAGSGYTAVSRDLEYSKKLITQFPDRFLYGRDSIKNIHIPLIDSLELPLDVKKLVMYGNAKRLVRE